MKNIDGDDDDNDEIGVDIFVLKEQSFFAIEI